MNLGFDTFDAFRFKQLIFVNSAAYAYTQIQIDQHTALFGENNLGKTSMLNALKLFLLPEVNFRNCPSKFNFRGANGKLYDGLDSFRYYLPEDRSFIILEAENPHNVFCIVLYRGAGTDKQEYARMVVPRPYQDIQHLFWDVSTATEDGIGLPVKEMTRKGTLDTLRKMDGESLTDRKAIQERLFTNQPYDKQAGRFSLLPLRNGAGSRAMDAWKKLVHLAFDISAQDDRTLPDTLATIIEGKKGRKEEELDLNLQTIVMEADRLREQDDRINRIANASEEWEALDRLYRREDDLRQRAAQAFADLDHAVGIEEERLKEAVSTEARKLQQSQHDESRLRERKEQLGRKVTASTATLAAQEQHAGQRRDEINRAHATLAEYPGFTPQAVIEALDDHIAEQEAAIQGFGDKAIARGNLEAVNRRLEENKRSARQRSETLENRRPTLLDGLSVAHASILHSLNNALGTTPGTLSPEQQQAFQDFADHFHDQAGYLTLGQAPDGISLADVPYREYDAEKSRQQRIADLQQLNEVIEKDEEKRKRLMEHATLSAKEIASKQKEAEKAVADAIRDKDAVTLLAPNERKLKADEEQLALFRDELAELQRQLEDATGAWREADAFRQRAFHDLQAAKSAGDQVERQRERLCRIGSDPNNVFEGLHRRLSPTPGLVTESAMAALEADEQALRALHRDMETALRGLLAKRILPDLDDHAYKVLTKSEIDTIHDRFKAVYDTLATEIATHRYQLTRHNSTTRGQVEMLRDAKSLVSSFIRGINEDIGRFSISNLDEIQIGYELHPRFEQLLSDLDKADLLSDELQDRRIYEQLKTFQAEFFTKETSRTGVALSLEKILTAVTYRYRLKGEEKWTSNSQSNGTTMMITTCLLSVLMSDLMEADTQVTMPLVMDEFGSLATRNMRTAREIAERHGYCLFVANPNRDAKITQVLENYVHLGLFHATQAYAANRTVVHHGLCETFSRQARIVPSTSDVDAGGLARMVKEPEQ